MLQAQAIRQCVRPARGNKLKLAAANKYTHSELDSTVVLALLRQTLRLDRDLGHSDDVRAGHVRTVHDEYLQPPLGLQVGVKTAVPLRVEGLLVLLEDELSALHGAFFDVDGAERVVRLGVVHDHL